MTNIFYKGKRVQLTEREFIASGGEGSVYRLSKSLVAKLPHKPKVWWQNGGVENIKKLSHFSHKRAATPHGLLFADVQGKKPVGFAVPFVSGEAMARFFASSFWKKTGFTFKDAEYVAGELRDLYEAVHAKGWLLVDPNEYNVLLSPRPPFAPTVIDTDSWYLGGSAQQLVQMPSITDYRHKKLGQESDWYAWAVTTFQLFAGIHPYRGTAPGFKRGDFQARAKQGVSVFRPEVKVPAAVRPIEKIPDKLREWYETVFEHGLRSAPPEAFGKASPLATPALRRVVSGGGALSLEKVAEGVTRWYSAGYYATERELISLAGKECIAVSAPPEILWQEKEGLVWVADKQLILLARGRQLTAPLPEGRPLLLSEYGYVVDVQGRLLRLSPVVFGGKLFVKQAHVLSVPPQATRFFDGVGIAEVFGKRFVFNTFDNRLPVSRRVPELDGLRIVTARGLTHGAAFLVAHAGGFERVLLWERGARRVLRHSVPVPELSVAEHPKGFLLEVRRDGELLLWDPRIGSERRLRHPSVVVGMELFVSGGVTYALHDGTLFRLKTH